MSTEDSEWDAREKQGAFLNKRIATIDLNEMNDLTPHGFLIELCEKFGFDRNERIQIDLKDGVLKVEQ